MLQASGQKSQKYYTVALHCKNNGVLTFECLRLSRMLQQTPNAANQTTATNVSFQNAGPGGPSSSSLGVSERVLGQGGLSPSPPPAPSFLSILSADAPEGEDSPQDTSQDQTGRQNRTDTSERPAESPVTMLGQIRNWRSSRWWSGA
jgi:hypothetical protein